MRKCLGHALLVALIWLAAPAWAQFTPPAVIEDCNLGAVFNTGNWSAPIRPGDTAMESNGAQCKPQTSGPRHNSWWNAATYGPDMAMSADLTDGVGAVTLRYLSLFVRVQAPNTAGVDAYECRFNSFDTNIQIHLLENNVATEIVRNDNVTLASGHQIGCQVVGSTVSAWLNTGSGWVQQTSVVDTTIAGSGFAGIGGTDASMHFDNIRAGTVSATALEDALQPLL